MVDRHTFEVEGMTCSGCEQRISRSVERLHGVQDVTADHQTGELRITFEPALVSADVIAKHVRDTGYTVTV